MRILWSIHLYPPKHNCGSEYVAHNLNKYLISKGHEVRVILHQAEMHQVKVPYEYEGVEVIGATGHLDAYRWADVIMTHLDYTQFTIMLAHAAKKPIIHFVHNDIPYSSIQNGFHSNYVVYNSEWVKESIGYKWPNIVFHPPCDYDFYNVCDNPEENENITLISLNKNKGGEMFYKIAEQMVSKQFMGVVGSYDEQILRHEVKNVSIVPNSSNVREYYKKTRILLMPSAYESWGRTATEAMCNGIPVICCPTPGLKENCGDAGIYVGKMSKDGKSMYRGEVKDWVREIKKLDDKVYYKEMSERVRARAKELRPENELVKLEQFIKDAKFTG